MKTLSRAEFANIQNKSILPSIEDIVYLSGSIGVGPKFEEELPSWITDTMGEIASKLETIWNKPINTLQVTEKGKQSRGSNIGRYIGQSYIEDEDGIIGLVAMQNCNLAISSSNIVTYIPWRVGISAQLPLGDFQPQTVEILKYIVTKLTSFEAIFPPSGMEAEIYRCLKGTDGNFEPLQYGREVLGELGIDVSKIKITPPF